MSNCKESFGLWLSSSDNKVTTYEVKQLFVICTSLYDMSGEWGERGTGRRRRRRRRGGGGVSIIIWQWNLAESFEFRWNRWTIGTVILGYSSFFPAFKSFTSETPPSPYNYKLQTRVDSREGERRERGERGERGEREREGGQREGEGDGSMCVLLSFFADNFLQNMYKSDYNIL